MIVWDVVSAIWANASARKATKVMIVAGRFRRYHQVLYLLALLLLHLHHGI